MGAKGSKSGETGGEAGATSGASGAASGSSKSAAGSSSSGAGAYLVLGTDSGGVLTLHWADAAPAGSLLFFAPKKTVPEFKKTQNAGRMEIIRNLGVGTKKLYEGVVQFVKEGASYDGTLKVLDDSKFEIWTCSGSKCAKVARGSSIATTGLDAVAAMPANNESYKGVKTIDLGAFVGTAIREGAAWKR